MFTGIIEELGNVQTILRGGGLTLTVCARDVVEDLEIGHSISVNGVCLTVTDCDPRRFTVQAVWETLQTTTLGSIRVGDGVNLERAMRPSDRLGGHIVTGHVDGIGVIRSKVERENSVLFSMDVPKEISRYIVPKGSVAVDGVSLTVADVIDSRVIVSIIPHTVRVTTFGFRKSGDEVNIEADLIGKYVERFIGSKQAVLTPTRLREMGY
jgi:riboflavin synthase